MLVSAIHQHESATGICISPPSCNTTFDFLLILLAISPQTPSWDSLLHFSALDSPQMLPPFKLSSSEPWPGQHSLEGPTYHSLPVYLVRDSRTLCGSASTTQQGMMCLLWKWKWYLLSCVLHFATPWTVTRQAPPSMGFSRQESWSG